MNPVTDGIVAPAPPATPKPVPSRLAALTEFFRGRPMDPARAQSMRGKIVAGISAVSVAAVIAGGATGCASEQGDRSYGYPLAETPTTTAPFQVVVQDLLVTRYQNWNDQSGGPGAVYLRDAEGGDGYEVNWYQPELDAPIPIAPEVMYGEAPPGTQFETDPYGNRYPADPEMRDAMTASTFTVQSVELQQPPETYCVAVGYELPDGREGLAGTFFVNPAAGDGRRVSSIYASEPCPDGPSTEVEAPVRQIGPDR